MSISFRPGIRENVGLLIGLAGGTGSGKTYSGMRLAAGIASALGGKPFAVIDTESRRALHYADAFKFEHAELRPPFRPSAFEDAILSADRAGYPVILVDSMSHEHAGEGGLLEWHEDELQRMAGDDYKRREACKMAAWINPKLGHKHMVQRLLQVRAHLILCFRAEEKVEMVRGDDGRMKMAPKKSRTGKDGWIPVCEKSLPFELTASFLLTDERPGFPLPIKLQEQHRTLFPVDKPITEESGDRLARWAAGGTDAPKPASQKESLPPLITDDQALALESRCTDNGVDPAALKAAIKNARGYPVARFAQIRAEDHKRAEDWITSAIERRKAAATA